MTMLAALLALSLPAALQTVPGRPVQGAADIVAAAAPAEWRAIAGDDLLVIELAPDARGKPRRVIVQLIAAPFARAHVANIRRLARAHWWDGTAVVRVQDNYVAQWGDPTEKKPLPPGLAVPGERDYTVILDEARARAWSDQTRRLIDARRAAQPAGDDSPPVDSYALFTGHIGGFPAALALAADRGGVRFEAWPVHCYASVGVGRNLSPDTGSGAELYAVIGHAPRHLDRNIAVVGRVVQGIEHLSSLPRGTGALGFYETPPERTPIVRARLASELPATGRPAFEQLSTDGDSFARYVDARANRRESFFIRPAGGVDICNAPVPVRARAAR